MLFRSSVITLQIICSRDIDSEHRTIPAVGEHVIAQEALAGRGVDVGTDESTDLGIIISGLEVVQLRILGKALAITTK